MLAASAVEKLNRRACYLTQNSTKSLCQPSDSANFCFLDLLRLCSFCASFSDNLVTVTSLGPSRTTVSQAQRFPLSSSEQISFISSWLYLTTGESPHGLLLLINNL